MNPAFATARQTFSQGGSVGSFGHGTAASAALWQQQLGRDLNLDELYLLKQLASDGVGGCMKTNKAYGPGYGGSTNSHLNLPQNGFDDANLAAAALTAVGVASAGSNFNLAKIQPFLNVQNGISGNSGSQGGQGGSLLGSSNDVSSNNRLSAADGALAAQLAMSGLSGGVGLSSAAAAAAASRGAFGEGPRIYVGGVPDLVTVAMVRDHFSRWGLVRDVHFPKERTSRRRRHFCFVTFESLQAAERAVAESNREIGGYPVAAINIPTDRLTHYGLRQGGLASLSPASPLRGSSMYGSLGASVSDIGLGTSLRSASLATTSAYNNVTHQIGSQRVHSLRDSQPSLFSSADNFVAAAATHDEISAALAALRMSGPSDNGMSNVVSPSSFPMGGNHALYQNGTSTAGDGHGIPLSHLNTAMQNNLLALAAAQAGASSYPGSHSTTRVPSSEFDTTRAASDGGLLSGPDPALSPLHMNGGVPGVPHPYSPLPRTRHLNLGPGTSGPPLMTHDLSALQGMCGIGPPDIRCASFDISRLSASSHATSVDPFDRDSQESLPVGLLDFTHLAGTTSEN